MENVTFVMLQSIPSAGSLPQRVSHIFHFTDDGDTNLWDSNITTDPAILNPYLKLNLTIEGRFSAWNSSLDFPGWVWINGTSATLQLNRSNIGPNQDLQNQSYDALGQTIVADTSYAPSILIYNGANLVSFASNISDTYSDNITMNGSPGPLPFTDDSTLTLGPTASETASQFATPTNSTSLIQDLLYPYGLSGCTVAATYTMNSGSIQSSQVYAEYNSTQYLLGTLSLGVGVDQIGEIPCSASLVHAINLGGIQPFLNSTTSFSGSLTSTFQLDFGPIQAGTVTISQTQLLSVPSLEYNIVVNGHGSRISMLDSGLDINWADLPASPTSSVEPFPWSSNKLILSGGSTAMMLDLVAEGAGPGASPTSPIVPQSGSSAFLFHRISVLVTGKSGVPYPGAVLNASPIGTQANVRLAAELNSLKTSDPDIWNFSNYWDGQHQVSTYGGSPASGSNIGMASLLLAYANLSALNLPEGQYLGDYNLTVSVPSPVSASESLDYSIPPFPSGLQNDSPEVGPTFTFDGYTAALTIISLTLSVDGQPFAGRIRVGQVLAVSALLENVGPAPVDNLSGAMTFESNFTQVLVDQLPTTQQRIPYEQTAVANFSWRVSEADIGNDLPEYGQANVSITWNGGTTGAGGTVNASKTIDILPSEIRILSLGGVSSNLTYGVTYTLTGRIQFNGTGDAKIILEARGPLLTSVNLSSIATPSGNFTLSFNSTALQIGVEYQIGANSSYDGVFSPVYNLQGTYRVVIGPAPVLKVVGVMFVPMNHSSGSSVRIGDQASVDVEFRNTGSLSSNNLSVVGTFFGVNGTQDTIIGPDLMPFVVPQGGASWTNWTWNVTESSVGRGGEVMGNLLLNFTWNGDSITQGGGAGSYRANLTILPSFLAIASVNPLPEQLFFGTTYSTNGTVAFNGSGFALVKLYATPIEGGPSIQVGSSLTLVGKFEISINTSYLQIGSDYALYLNASYNSVYSPDYGVPGHFLIIGTGSCCKSSPTPLWVWVVITGLVAGIGGLVALMLTRKRGQILLECGECGAILTSKDLACSRCGTTPNLKAAICPNCGVVIPASQSECPGCRTAPVDRPSSATAHGADQLGYENHLRDYRAAAQGELGEEHSDAEFWKWWKQQPAYQNYRDWKAGRVSSASPVAEQEAAEANDHE